MTERDYVAVVIPQGNTYLSLQEDFSISATSESKEELQTTMKKLLDEEVALLQKRGKPIPKPTTRAKVMAKWGVNNEYITLSVFV